MSEDQGNTSIGNTVPVDTKDSLDPTRLTDWMRANVAGFSGTLDLSRFEGGQSNPTFLLRSEGQAYVLRRKPLGNLMPSAHAVDREFRILSALHQADFLVPEPYALCTDPGVIGAEFYVMQALDGRIFWNQQLPDVPPEQRADVFRSQAATLAKLHSLDPAKIGLADYGRPGNFFERQVNRWIRQYRTAQTGDIAKMERLIEWIPGSIPEQKTTAIVHGDYMLHNIMFHPTEPRVLGVLDWELSTIGDPLADLSYMLMQWHTSGGPQVGLKTAPLADLRIPRMEEILAVYCEAAGRNDIPNLDWYIAFNLFRLAAIAQGIIARIKEGTAASSQAGRAAERLMPMIDGAWEFAQRAGAK